MTGEEWWAEEGVGEGANRSTQKLGEEFLGWTMGTFVSMVPLIRVLSAVQEAKVQGGGRVSKKRLQTEAGLYQEVLKLIFIPSNDLRPLSTYLLFFLSLSQSTYSSSVSFSHPLFPLVSF